MSKARQSLKVMPDQSFGASDKVTDNAYDLRKRISRLPGVTGFELQSLGSLSWLFISM